MSCSSCSTKFGFLKKEVGCEVCGFSFCSKCCKKSDVPSGPEEAQKKLICNKCLSTLTSKQTAPSKFSPPLALKKRMASLKKQSTSDSKFEWSDKRDQELAERLQKLKRDRIKDTVPSEKDIAERLAKLKGMDPAKFNTPPIEVYRPPAMLTVVEQASALMEQMGLEAELDSRRVKPEDEIAARLARLRDQEPPEKGTSGGKVNKIDYSSVPSHMPQEEEMDIDKVHSELAEQEKSLTDAASKELKGLMSDGEYAKILQSIPKEKERNNSDDEENEANELVEKLLAADPDVEGLDSLNDELTEESLKSDQEETEEFPWCIICTEDAKIRCFSCDADLYCLRCFQECHDSLDIKDHKTCPYLPPKRVSM